MTSVPEPGAGVEAAVEAVDAGAAGDVVDPGGAAVDEVDDAVEAVAEQPANKPTNAKRRSRKTQKPRVPARRGTLNTMHLY
jgi:hypothetical protein